MKKSLTGVVTYNLIQVVPDLSKSVNWYRGYGYIQKTLQGDIRNVLAFSKYVNGRVLLAVGLPTLVWISSV